MRVRAGALLLDKTLAYSIRCLISLAVGQIRNATFENLSNPAVDAGVIVFDLSALKAENAV